MLAQGRGEWSVCDLFFAESSLPGHGTLFDGSPRARITGRNGSLQAKSRRKSDICIRWTPSRRSEAGDGKRGRSLPSDGTLLEEVDRKVQIQRAVARDGQPLRINPK